MLTEDIFIEQLDEYLKSSINKFFDEEEYEFKFK